MVIARAEGKGAGRCLKCSVAPRALGFGNRALGWSETRPAMRASYSIPRFSARAWAPGALSAARID